MPFLIVQTIEAGQPNLSIVPSSWVENGKLWWPPKSKLHKAKDEKSKPNKDEWSLMDCVLKRKNIKTYQLARAELLIMAGHSDTDTNDMVAQRKTVVQNQEEINFELMANKLRCNKENYSNVPENTTITTNDETIPNVHIESLNMDQIFENQKMLSEKIDNMLQIQGIILENQHKIVQSLATHSVQLQEISTQLAEKEPSVTLLKDANPVDTESFSLKPVENQRELILLDQCLADRAEKKKLQNRLSFLCSASKGEGKTCAYKLLDILFTRDFLCNCSWAGGSRGDRSKIALKDYKNILNFFHGMIRTWDPTYTVQDNETFFKIIAKNSKQRKSMKNLRMSSKRSRKDKNNLDKQQKNRNKRQPSDDEKESEVENMQIQENAPSDESKDTEVENMQIQEYAPNGDSKETEGGYMQIKEHVTSDESREITERESMQNPEQEKRKTIPLNNKSDDNDIEVNVGVLIDL